MAYKGSGRKGGIKYTLSVKSTLFWDFSMHTVLLKDCMLFSQVTAASGRRRIDSSFDVCRSMPRLSVNVEDNSCKESRYD